MQDLTKVPTADLLAEIKRRIEADDTPTITLKYHKSSDGILTAEDRELLLAFVNQPEEMKHIATFEDSPKEITVYMKDSDAISLGEDEDRDVGRFYFTSSRYNSTKHAQDIRFRAYARTNSLKRFTA